LKNRTRTINPRLKSGVKFWRSDFNRQLLIGTRFKNYLLPDSFGDLAIEPALALLKVGRLEPERHAVLIAALKGLNLIDFQSTELHYQYRDNRSEDIGSLPIRSVAQESFLARFEIEASGVSGAEDVTDGGVARVLSRRDFFIEIYGTGRLLFPLLSNLIASGFDNCDIATRSEIKVGDLSGGFLRRSDAGFDTNRKLIALKEEISLYPEYLGSGGKPDLIISIGSPTPEVMQNWLTLKIPQLFIDYENSSELRIGPYVMPGNGACYNCLSIGEIERGLPSLRSILGNIESEKKPHSPASEFELTASLASLGSSLVALETIKIADSESSNLHQRTMLISSLNYLEPQITSWERSPRCGCNWS
jgi:hypothetical protein